MSQARGKLGLPQIKHVDVDHNFGLKVTKYINLSMVRRTKTKYFQGGRLLWDEHTSAGKYVRENCKTIKVIITC